MPVIFNSTEQMLAWLDFVQVKFDDALDLLQNHIDHLEIDPVSNYVFKKSNTGPEVIRFDFDKSIQISRSPLSCSVSLP